MQHFIKRGLAAAGIDVRLVRNLPKARKQQKHEDLIGRWRLLSHYEPKTILDIGANEGQCAALLHEAFPKARILSFEPLRDCFEIVSAFHQRERCGRAYAFALGNENTKQTIHRNGFTPSSSLLQMQPMHHQEYPQTVESTPEEIQVRRLDDVLSELEIESPLIIKADVQGFEDRVIQGGENTFRMASAAVLEVTSYPLYEDQATFDSINQQLKSLDFVFRGVIDQNISRQDRRILQFDAIFENQAVVSTTANDGIARAERG